MAEDLNQIFAEFAENLGLKPEILEHFIQVGLDEDVVLGDLTVDSVVRSDSSGTARIFAKSIGRIAGIALACRVFYHSDNNVEILNFVQLL